jgi:adenylate cyclase
MSERTVQVGILFADVAGSTRLYDLLGDEAARNAVEGCIRLMTETVIHHTGAVIKTVGDEVMAVFYDAAAVYEAAVAIQRRINSADPQIGLPLSVRVGFHFGPAIEERSDYFGQTVNIAARLVALAKASQILTAADNLHLFKPGQRLGTRELSTLPMKGRADGIGVLEVKWQETPDTTVMPATRRRTSVNERKLKLTYCGREWVFDARHEAVGLGRDPTNDLVFHDSSASRRHARIERRRDKWFLVDQSANGTFVTFDGQARIRLHHEELILHRPGVLSLEIGGAAVECVEFAVE